MVVIWSLYGLFYIESFIGSYEKRWFRTLNTCKRNKEVRANNSIFKYKIPMMM